MVFTLHRRGLFLCLFIKRIFLVRTLCDHHLHKVFTRVWKSRQGQCMSVMELHDLYAHEDKSPCLRPLPDHPILSPFYCPAAHAVRDPVALSATLSSRTRPQTAPSVPRPRPASPAQPSPDQPRPDQTTPHAPRPCARPCARPHAPQMPRQPPTLSRCPASHTPRPPQKPLQAPVSAFTPSPVSYTTPAPKRAQSAPETHL